VSGLCLALRVALERAEAGLGEIGTAEVGLHQIGTAEVGPHQIGTSQIRLPQIGAYKNGISEPGSAQVCDSRRTWMRHISLHGCSAGGDSR